MKKVADKITWTWKKFITLVLGILGIGTLTSCYGCPDYFEQYCSGTVRGSFKDSGTTEPVKDIKVELLSEGALLDTTCTDEDGFFGVGADSSCTGEAELIFRDIDGKQNGSWKLQKRKIQLNGNYIRKIEVTLEEDNE